MTRTVYAHARAIIHLVYAHHGGKFKSHKISFKYFPSTNADRQSAPQQKAARYRWWYKLLHRVSSVARLGVLQGRTRGTSIRGSRRRNRGWGPVRGSQENSIVRKNLHFQLAQKIGRGWSGNGVQIASQQQKKNHQVDLKINFEFLSPFLSSICQINDAIRDHWASRAGVVLVIAVICGAPRAIESNGRQNTRVFV